MPGFVLPIEFLEDQFPQIVILVLALVVLGLCLVAGLKYKDLAAMGYILPILITIAVYVAFMLDGLTLATKQFFGRIVISMLLLNIGAWRVYTILASRRKPQ